LIRFDSNMVKKNIFKYLVYLDIKHMHVFFFLQNILSQLQKQKSDVYRKQGTSAKLSSILGLLALKWFKIILKWAHRNWSEANF